MRVRSIRRWLFALLAAVAIGSTVDLRATEQKSVLVLYANRRDSQVAIVGERELPGLLEDGLPEGLDYYAEYLDPGRFPDLVYESAFQDFIRSKYAGKRFDLIIAMQDVARQFLRVNRDRLVPGTLVVFFASAPGTARIENSTGVFGPVDFSGSVDLALALQPDLRHVFVILGAGSGDRSYESLARAQFARFEPRLTVAYLTGLPTKELDARLATLPSHSIVYYVVVDKDGAGRIFHPIAYLDRLAARTNAPTYSWVESAMDHGIVGGSLKSHVLQAQTIARQALRVLHGERADAVPVSSPNLNVLQVDSRQMRRWRIEESRLPAGTIVKFRQPSAWDLYGLYIIGAAVVVITQTLLIAGLLLQSEKRRRVESELRWREADLQNSYERIRDLGARLLQAQDTERSRIARELHDDISQQVALLEIDLEQLSGSIDADARLLASDARDRATSIARSVHDLSHRLHPAKLRLIGLVAALDGLRHELSRSDVAITFAYDGVPSALPQELTLCLFRVAQEALQNALKYSGARQISLDLRWSAHELTMTIVDDGAGFDVERAWGSGLGLVSMSERLEGVGGSVAVQSRPGEGTRVEASVPAHVVQRTLTDSITAELS